MNKPCWPILILAIGLTGLAVAQSPPSTRPTQGSEFEGVFPRDQEARLYRETLAKVENGPIEAYRVMRENRDRAAKGLAAKAVPVVHWMPYYTLYLYLNEQLERTRAEYEKAKEGRELRGQTELTVAEQRYQAMVQMRDLLAKMVPFRRAITADRYRPKEAPSRIDVQEYETQFAELLRQFVEVRRTHFPLPEEQKKEQ